MILEQRRDQEQNRLPEEEVARAGAREEIPEGEQMPEPVKGVAPEADLKNGQKGLNSLKKDRVRMVQADKADRGKVPIGVPVDIE